MTQPSGHRSIVDYAQTPPPQGRLPTWSRVMHGVFAAGAGLVGALLIAGGVLELAMSQWLRVWEVAALMLFGLLLLILCAQWTLLAIKG